MQLSWPELAQQIAVETLDQIFAFAKADIVAVELIDEIVDLIGEVVHGSCTSVLTLLTELRKAHAQLRIGGDGELAARWVACRVQRSPGARGAAVKGLGPAAWKAGAASRGHEIAVAPSATADTKRFKKELPANLLAVGQSMMKPGVLVEAPASPVSRQGSSERAREFHLRHGGGNDGVANVRA